MTTGTLSKKQHQAVVEGMRAITQSVVMLSNSLADLQGAGLNVSANEYRQVMLILDALDVDLSDRILKDAEIRFGIKPEGESK